MHTTEAATINAQAPRHLNNKSAMEIVEYMRDHFKSQIVDSKGNLIPEKPLNKSTAYLMAIADALFDPNDWRNSFRANFPQCGDEWAKAAIIWYHGAQPHQTFIGVVSTGYACW